MRTRPKGVGLISPLGHSTRRRSCNAGDIHQEAEGFDNDGASSARAWLAPLIVAYCPDGGVVLDPFMGSGSTLRAAKNLGFAAVGIEIEMEYCRNAKARLAQCVLPMVNVNNNDSS